MTMANVTKRLFTDETGQGILTQLTAQNAYLAALHGDRANLATTDKTSLVAAINEIVSFSIALKEGTGAGLHNSLYRGKYLGDHLTAEQWAAIASGTFEGLWLGDYWIINGVTWRVADFDYFLHSGDTECTTHHVAIVPDQTLYNARMNPTNTTDGAYVGSEMYTTNLAQAKTIINNAFGAEHILNHRVYLHNAVSNGYPSAGAWCDSTVELMTEQMVYGGKVFAPTSDGSTVPMLHTVCKSQLALFRLCPEKIIATALASGARMWYWLRDVVCASGFANVHHGGTAYWDNASTVGGVRPAFLIH